VPRTNETIDLLLTRRSSKAVTMVEPGPSAEDLELILRAGHRVPDHGKLGPWRFLVFRDEARAEFGALLRQILETREPDAGETRLELEETRFTRAPLVVGVVSQVDPNHKIPEWEQVLSAGAACQNMLVAANALGFTAQWLTEWYAYDPDVDAALGVGTNERIAGFLYFGSRSEPADERPRPPLEDRITHWRAKG